MLSAFPVWHHIQKQNCYECSHNSTGKQDGVMLKWDLIFLLEIKVHTFLSMLQCTAKLNSFYAIQNLQITRRDSLFSSLYPRACLWQKMFRSHQSRMGIRDHWNNFPIYLKRIWDSQKAITLSNTTTEFCGKSANQAISPDLLLGSLLTLSKPSFTKSPRKNEMAD